MNIGADSMMRYAQPAEAASHKLLKAKPWRDLEQSRRNVVRSGGWCKIRYSFFETPSADKRKSGKAIDSR